MATVYAIGTNQSKWSVLSALTDNSALSAPGVYASSGSIWSSDTTKHVVSTLDEGNTLQFEFYGSASDNNTASAKIWVIVKVPPTAGGADEYTAICMAELSLTFGGATGGTTGRFSTSRFVDTITIVTDATPTPPGIRLVGDVPEGMANMTFDSLGAIGFIIELRRGTATSLGALYRVV